MITYWLADNMYFTELQNQALFSVLLMIPNQKEEAAHSRQDYVENDNSTLQVVQEEERKEIHEKKIFCRRKNGAFVQRSNTPSQR